MAIDPKNPCPTCGGPKTYHARRCVKCPPVDRPREWTREMILDAIRDWALERGRPPTQPDWRRAGYGHPSSSTVYKAFGSHSRALDEAGFLPNRPGPQTLWARADVAVAIRSWRSRRGGWPTEPEWNSSPGSPTCAGEWPTSKTVRRLFGSWHKALRAAGWVGPPTRAERVETTRALDREIRHRWREENPEKYREQNRRGTERRRARAVVS